MTNILFRSLLSLGSFYVACYSYFNVIIGSFPTRINLSLGIFAAFAILQIVILLFLIHLDRRFNLWLYGAELAIGISAAESLLIFHYLLGPCLFEILIIICSVLLIHFDSFDQSKEDH